MSAWDILGLAPTDDPGSVKAAYAATLKRWKQEPGDTTLDDIKQAYQQLLAELSGDAPAAESEPLAAPQAEAAPTPSPTPEAVPSAELALVRQAIDKIGKQIEDSGFDQATWDAISALLDETALNTLATRPLMEGELCKLLFANPPDWRFFTHVVELFDWSDANPFPPEQDEYHNAYDVLWHQRVSRPREAQNILAEHCHRIVEHAARDDQLPDAVAALNHLWDDEDLRDVLGSGEIHSTLLEELDRVYDLDEELLLAIANFYGWDDYQSDEFRNSFASRYHAIYTRSREQGYLQVLLQLRDGVQPRDLKESQYYYALLIAKKMHYYGEHFPLKMDLTVDTLREQMPVYKPRSKIKKDKFTRRAAGQGALLEHSAYFVVFVVFLMSVFAILDSMS